MRNDNSQAGRKQSRTPFLRDIPVMLRSPNTPHMERGAIAIENCDEITSFAAAPYTARSRAGPLLISNRATLRNDFVSPDEPVLIRAVRAVDGATKLPRKDDEDEEEREAEEGDFE